MPKAADFVIGVKVLEKKCFGSAGCNITYQIEPMYVGTARLPQGKEITIVYDIAGGEDPQTSRFTLLGDQMTFPAEETIQTASSTSVLTATATQVF